jgi:hypothetical protein
MRTSKVLRTIAVLSTSALVLGAFAAGPADAKKKKKKPPACPTYTAPDWAPESKTTIVTDAATADAPAEFALETAPGAGFSSADEPEGGTGAPSSAYHNIVVDSAAPDASLFVRAEYAPTWDYDIFLRTPEGAPVAYEADFNPLTAAGPTPVGGNEGAHPEPGAGQIDGAASADCTGYTLEVVSGTAPGGTVALTFWLE